MSASRRGFDAGSSLPLGLALAVAACATRPPAPSTPSAPIVWTPSLFADDGRPQFELVAEPDAQSLGSESSGAAARAQSCAPEPPREGVIEKLGVFTQTGSCAYDVVVTRDVAPYAVERGMVQPIDAPADVFREMPTGAAQAGESLLFATPHGVAVFSASTRRYLGTIGVQEYGPSLVPDRAGDALLVVDGRAFRLRATAGGRGRSPPVEVEFVAGWDEDSLASPFALFDGKPETEALVAHARLTLRLSRPILDPRIRVVSTGSPRVRATACPVGFDEQRVPVEGAAPLQDRAVAAPALLALVDMIRLDLVCDNGGDNGALCRVAEIEIE